MKVPVLFLFLIATLSAQPFTIGAKVGVPFLDTNGSDGESRPWTAGPSVEFRLPAGFAIEASAIYRRVGESNLFAFQTGVNTTALFANRIRGNYWEFPLLGKYYFRPRSAGWQPFLGAGWAFRTVGMRFDGTTIAGTTDLTNVAPYHARGRSELGLGVPLAAGVRLRAKGRIMFTPEVRYTRWGSQQTFFRKNEAGLFLGLGF